MIVDVLKRFKIYLHELTPNAISEVRDFFGLYEAKVLNPTQRHFAKFMSCIIKRRQLKAFEQLRVL
jgi:hypothetical protein